MTFSFIHKDNFYNGINNNLLIFLNKINLCEKNKIKTKSSSLLSFKISINFHKTKSCKHKQIQKDKPKETMKKDKKVTDGDGDGVKFCALRWWCSMMVHRKSELRGGFRRVRFCSSSLYFSFVLCFLILCCNGC